ncbi:MAG: hypothetical protein BGO70_08715 [Bacteroidetes bacterium 43-93]|nr:DUF2157 domain-containing protein [Bacteroidota bacterium]OJX00250.1 MAG: hypothetical protein BGO70_08715 [Bacteroidetes bacterium 43-93]
MQADKKEKELLTNAIEEWLQEGKLSKEQAEELKNTITVKDDPAQQIARYFFFIALSCVILAFGAIFIDDKMLEKFKVYFSLSNIMIAVLFTVLSAAAFLFIKRKKASYSNTLFEAYSVITSLLALTALIYYCKDIGSGPKYSGFLAIATVLLFALSAWLRSKALWIEGILALMGWYGAFSAWQSSNDLFLGMNYPMRFSVFGIVVLAFAYIQNHVRQLQDTQRFTYIAGLIILLTGLWGISIFGNYNSLEEWSKVRQVQVIWYALVFAVAGAAIFLYGIKKRDEAVRDIGLFALLINLYTRYFEYFWDNTNKGLFFLILGVSFWFIGNRVQKSKRVNKHLSA